MSFVNFFKKSNNKDSISPSYDDNDTQFKKKEDKYEKDNKNDDKYKRDKRHYEDDKDDKKDRYNKEEKENKYKKNERDNKDEKDNKDERDDIDERDDRDDEYESSRKNRTNDNYDPRKDQSIKNLDSFLYKKNIQILKIFKMRNRCIMLLILMKELGKCILIYVDPSKYQIECQANNSIVGRENVHDIELFRIDHKHIYEVCDCYPELMKLTKEHRIDIENEKNKVYLNHFEQICIQLNNFKKIVKSSNSKLGMITEYSISFINNDNDVELFTISDTSPNKFSKMKTYLVYDLSTFMNKIEEIEFEIERLVPSFIDELNKDNKELKKQIESKSVLNNINSIKSLLEKLETKKKNNGEKKKTSKEVSMIEEEMIKKFGTKVNIISGKKRGRIEIEYYSNDELERLIELILN